MGDQRNMRNEPAVDGESESQVLGSNSLAEFLAIPRDYAPESLAPPLDLERLHALVRGELTGDLLDEVCHLTASYRSWDEALAGIIRDQAERGGRDSGLDATA